MPSKSISLANRSSWCKILFESTNIVSISTEILRVLVESLLVVPESENVYSNWKEKELTINSLKSGVSTKDSAELRSSAAALNSLVGVLDFLTCLIDCGLLEAKDLITVGSNIIHTLLDASLFTRYQHVLSVQPEHLCGTLFGYDCKTGEDSLVFACWKRAITLVSTIITCIDCSSQNECHPQQSFNASSQSNNVVSTAHSMIADYSQLIRLITQFFSDYHFLLLLPFQPPLLRFSFNQLECINAVATMFSHANKHIKIWKLLCKQVYSEYAQKLCVAIQTLTALLGSGEDVLPVGPTVSDFRSFHIHKMCLLK